MTVQTQPASGNVFAVDSTTGGTARFARVSCESFGSSPAPPPLVLPFTELSDGRRAATLSDAQCETLLQGEGGCANSTGTVDYIGRRGELLATAVYPDGFERCQPPGSVLREICDDVALIPLDPGEVVAEEEGPVVDPGAFADCLTIWRDLDGTQVRHASWCPGDPAIVVEVPDTGSDPICLAVSSRNDNAQSSMKHRLPCFRRPAQPSPPNPIAIDFVVGSDQATIQFAHAERPAHGVVIEWQKKGRPETRQVTFVPRAAGVAAGDPVELPVSVGAEPVGADWHEEWCVRGFSVGGMLAGDADTGYSEWSAETCGDRSPPGAAGPTFLPWPKVPEQPYGDALAAAFAPADEIGLVLLSDPLEMDEICDTSSFECDIAAAEGCVGEPGTPGYATTSSCSLCGQIAQAMTVDRRFVVYRQARAGVSSPATDFHQITPYIDNPWCESQTNTLNDPWVTVTHIAAPHPWAGRRVLFADRFPFRGEGQLRYQFVFFDDRGEVAGQRLSNWVTVQ